jgi:hypothetical protein
MNNPGPAETRQITADQVAAESADDDTSAGEDEPASEDGGDRRA